MTSPSHEGHPGSLGPTPPMWAPPANLWENLLPSPVPSKKPVKNCTRVLFHKNNGVTMFSSLYSTRHVHFNMHQVTVKLVLKVPGLLNWPVTPPSLWALQERTGRQHRSYPSHPRNEERNGHPATFSWGTDSASSPKPSIPTAGSSRQAGPQPFGH